MTDAPSLSPTVCDGITRTLTTASDGITRTPPARYSGYLWTVMTDAPLLSPTVCDGITHTPPARYSGCLVDSHDRRSLTLPHCL